MDRTFYSERGGSHHDLQRWAEMPKAWKVADKEARLELIAQEFRVNQLDWRALFRQDDAHLGAILRDLLVLYSSDRQRSGRRAFRTGEEVEAAKDMLRELIYDGSFLPPKS